MNNKFFMSDVKKVTSDTVIHMYYKGRVSLILLLVSRQEVGLQRCHTERWEQFVTDECTKVLCTGRR